jgi:hypothetical protein
VVGIFEPVGFVFPNREIGCKRLRAASSGCTALHPWALCGRRSSAHCETDDPIARAIAWRAFPFGPGEFGFVLHVSIFGCTPFRAVASGLMALHVSDELLLLPADSWDMKHLLRRPGILPNNILTSQVDPLDGFTVMAKLRRR